MLFKLFRNQVSMCNFNFFFLCVSYKRKSVCLLIVLLLHYNIITFLTIYNCNWSNLTKKHRSNLKGYCYWYDTWRLAITSCNKNRILVFQRFLSSLESQRDASANSQLAYEHTNMVTERTRVSPDTWNCIFLSAMLNFILTTEASWWVSSRFWPLRLDSQHSP